MMMLAKKAPLLKVVGAASSNSKSKQRSLADAKQLDSAIAYEIQRAANPHSEARGALPREEDLYVISLMCAGVIAQEGNARAIAAKKSKKQSRAEIILSLYLEYRTRKPRAQKCDVDDHILAALEMQGIKLSAYTLENRYLKPLRDQSAIPKRHRIPYDPAR